MADQDPRAEELSKLKLALAIFSMHLDAFEARARGRLVVGKKLGAHIQPDIGLAIRAASAMSASNSENKID
jgi:hypothetical protein